MNNKPTRQRCLTVTVTDNSNSIEHVLLTSCYYSQMRQDDEKERQPRQAAASAR